MNANKSSGNLVCVGIGMTLGSHIGPLARSYIEQADVVFVAASDGVVEQWVEEMNADVRSLQPLYGEGRSRMETYHAMIDTLLAEVRKGRQVCAAFYGHPGVFAWPAHRAIELAREQGFDAHMEPGISAEDCLYADLGIDPGKFGCQHFEATQLMIYKRRVDPSACLVLWQAGVAGDRSLKRLKTAAGYRQILVDVLAKDYPLDHPVIIYRAVTLPIHEPRMETVALGDLPGADIGMEDTLVLEPAQSMQQNREVRSYIDELDGSILKGLGPVAND
ncbi:MAG: SAM-dependent methyltransferase [Rhodanobacteraceae bacterium]